MNRVKFVASIFLIVIGFGLCIGGIFLPPLLAIGVPLLTTGLSMLATTDENKEKILTALNSRRGVTTSPAVDVPVEPPVLSFSHNYHVSVDHSAPTPAPTPALVPDVETEEKTDGEHASNISLTNN